MSSTSALLLALTGALAGPMPDGGVVGEPVAASGACAGAIDPHAITVCARRTGPSPRLPMPDDRFAAGEEVHYSSDGARQDPGPPGEPSRLGDTLVKLFKAARSAVTGADPDY